MVRRSRDTGDRVEEYRLLREPHCRGFEAAQRQTAREWVVAQGLDEYNFENDRLVEVISLKARLSSKALPPSLSELVYTALYDLDGFRERLHAGSLEPAGLDPGQFEKARTDETALLHLNLEWVKQFLTKSLGR
jgi:hypothetical protein